MRKYLTGNPIKQMPQISDKGRLNAKSLLQLPCDRLDQSSFACERSYGLLGQWRVLLVHTTHRCVKINLSFGPQFLLQGLGTIAFITQNPAHTVRINQRFSVLDIMLVGRGQNKTANDPNVGDLQMKAIAEECASKPLSVCGGVLKLFSCSAANKFTDFYRNAVDNLKIMVRILAQILKKALFNMPQICTLTDKITSVRKLWEQRSSVAIIILINPLIGIKSQVFADQFHCNNLTVSQFWQWSAGSQRVIWKISFAKIISHYEHIDDIINKFHFRPPCLNKVLVSPLLSAMRSFFLMCTGKLAQRVRNYFPKEPVRVII